MSEPTAPIPSSRPMLVRVVSVGVRLITMAGIVACGLFLFFTYRALFTPSQPLAELPKDPREIDLFAPGLSSAMLPGSWAFGSQHWALGLATLPEEQVGKRLTGMGPVPPPHTEPPTELERTILEWFRRSEGATIRDEGQQRICLMTKGQMRVRAVFDIDGDKAWLRFGQAAWPQVNEQWTVLEVVPLHPQEFVKATNEHLLPLPMSAQVVARRLTPQGDVAAELVQLPADHALPFTRWTDAGWQLEHLEGDLRGYAYKDQQRIHWWQLPADQGPLSGLLFITRERQP